jgi:uncharacterized repeat protein (TIGR01451 family)
MPLVTEPAAAPGRSILKLSLGCTLVVIAVLLAVVFLCGVPSVEAATCTLTTTAPITSWKAPANWTGCGGNYPGQATLDTAVVIPGSYTLNVDIAVPNGVAVQIGGGAVALTINTGNSIQLESSSSMGSGGTSITVGGGTLILNNVGNISGAGSYTATLNSGTASIIGTYTESNASFTIAGGTLTNSGTWNVTGGSTLALSGGTLINNLTVDVQSGSPSNTFTWAGGTLDGTGVTQIGGAPAATLNVTATSTMNGTGTVNATTPNFILGGSINSTSGTPRIINVGTMTVNSSANIAPQFDNQGTTSLPTTGLALGLLGGGTQTGGFGFGSSGSSISFNGAHTFNSSVTWTAPSGATLRILGGTTTLTSPLALTVSDFVQSGGTLTGGGNVLVNNTFQWTGGTQQGPGTTQLQANCVGNLNGSTNVTLDGRNFNLSGVTPTLHYAPTGGSALSVNNGSLISVLSGSLFLDNNSPINSNGAGVNGLLVVGGGPGSNLVQTVAGINLIQVPVGLTGVNGSIKPGAGGTIKLLSGSAATYDWGAGASIDLTAAGSKIELAGGVFKFNNTTAPAIAGGGIFALSNTAIVNLNGRSMQLQNGQQDGASTWLGGSPAGGTLTVLGTYNFNGGTMDGQNATPQASLTTSSLGGVVNFNGAAPMTLTNGWKVTEFPGIGGLNLNPATSPLAVNSGAQIANVATFTFQNTNGLGITSDGLGSPAFINSATVAKNVTGTSPIGVPFTNSGTVNVNAGTLQIAAGGGTTSPNTFNVASILEIVTGTFSLSSGTSLSGAGTYLLTSGGLSLFASTSAQNYTQTSGLLSFTGSSTFTVNGNLNWNGGTMTGLPGNIMRSNGTLNIGSANPTTLQGGMTLDIAGSASYNANNTNFLTLFNSSNVIVENSPLATFTFTTASQISSDATATHFDNLGVTNKNGAGTVVFNTAFNQGGLAGAGLNVNGGTLTFNTGGQANGPMTVAGGAGVSFAGGVFGLNAGAQLNGAGIYGVPAGGTLAVNNPTNVPTNFNLSGGTLTGDASFTINPGSTLKWTGGTMTSAAGSGATDNFGGTLILDSTAGALTLSNRTLSINSGTSTWQAGGNPLNIVTAQLSIGALFDIQAGAPNISGSGFINIVSGGTLRKSVLGSVLQIAPALINSGNIDVQAGSIVLNSPGTVTHTGTFNAGTAGAQLSFANGTHQLGVGSAFTGPGMFIVAGGTLFNGTASPTSIPNLKLVSGSLANNPFATTTTFIFDGGSVDANTTSAGTITLSGTNGNMNLTRSLTIQPGAVATYSTAANNLIINAPSGFLVNKGTFTLATARPILLVGTPLAGTYLFQNFAGGTLNGNGTINVPVSNDGNLNPGTSPGGITINNAFTQTANGVLNIDLAGTTPVTQYDQLTVSGAATFGGTLNAILAYTPANGDTFNVMPYASQSGAFTTMNLPTFPPNGTIQANITPTLLQLVAVAPSADLGINKALVGSLVAGSPATYTITVKNFDATNNATNVQITDPTPAPLTISSVTGACTALPCTIPLITAGSTATITATYNVPSNASGSVTNTATITSSLPGDFNPANDTSTVTTTIVQKADITVTKVGPSSANPGSTIQYDITVTNAGPSDAASVTLTDSFSPAARLTFVSATGACSAFPCALGNMVAGSTKSVQAKYQVVAGPTVNIVNTASASSASTPDPNAANNSATVSTSTGCPTAAPKVVNPADKATNVVTNGTLVWSDVGAGSYKVYLGPAGTGCSTLIANIGATSIPYGGLTAGTTYEWRVETGNAGCPILTSSCATFTTASNCPATPPVPQSPLSGSVTSPATFTWSAVPTAIDYQLFVNNNLVATTSATSASSISFGNGLVSWYVVARFAAPCGSLQSQTVTFNGCSTADAPVPSLVAQAASGEGYDFTFTNTPGSTGAIVDESTDNNFPAGLTTSQTVTTNSVHFQHSVNVTTAFYYRVRAILPCGTTPNSVVVRVVLAPFEPPTKPNVSVPFGNKNLVAIVVHVPGFPGQTLPFTASLDNKPWLIRVQPTTGTLPPEGLDFTVFADPSILPNGTFTGTLLLSVTTPGSGTIVNQGTTPVNVPVSISLVTPITPTKQGGAVQTSVIVPSAGHLDGVNSHWQSDVFVANTSQQKVKYQLTFSPDDASKGVKQTLIDVDAGATTALVDIIKTWYGVGSLGESANGVLEIRPFDATGKASPANDDVSVSLATIASSRAYNVSTTSNATLGQFMPALPFSGFIGRALDQAHAATVLGLQQIAQNADFRSNIGILEASGQPASVLISVFDGDGKKLLDLPLDLKGGEQRQLNSLLAQNKITLDTGRIEVKVTGGDGKVTAYASVVDNKSGDPYLISGVPLGQNASDHFVLLGVADLNTGTAAWRTDMQILNPTATAQVVTLTFNPQNGGGAPQSTTLTLNAGQLKQFNSVLASLFGASNTGGTIHVTTAAATPLVVTGRTFDLTPSGTFGQFVPAVTAADAVGLNGPTLHILQAEDSVRYRTNLGIAEVTGKPATVEVQVILPDSKIAPSTQIPIPANGFVQVPVIQSLGLSNIYNARITVKVVGGDGKVSAYNSVIDQVTQAPTYVPAQH